MRFLLLAAIALIGCSPKVYEVRLVNNMPRAIEYVYLFKPGAADHGASRAHVAANTTAIVKLPAGNTEVFAISEKIPVDDRTRMTMSASYVFQVEGPVELVFHDSTQPEPARRPGLHNITFRVPTPPPPPPEARETPAAP